MVRRSASAVEGASTCLVSGHENLARRLEFSLGNQCAHPFPEAGEKVIAVGYSLARGSFQECALLGTAPAHGALAISPIAKATLCEIG